MGYTAEGKLTRSKLTQNQTDVRYSTTTSTTLEAGYTWSEYGQLASATYPSGRKLYNKFDAMGRTKGLDLYAKWCPNCQPATTNLVSDTAYNKAGQITQLGYAYGGNETRTYDDYFRLTGIQATGLNLSYAYAPAGQDTGRITSETRTADGTSSTVGYAYDQLNRLATANSVTGATTNWGLSFGYDVYGNRTGQTVTAGSAPAFSASFGSNNRMVGYSYDNNGNQLTTPDGATLEYDADNRLTKWTKQGQVDQYQYHPSGWRLSKGSEKYLYGPGGQLLESYRGWNDITDYVYFGGRLLYTLSAGQAVTRVFSDRLGSTRVTETIQPFGGGWTTRNYYPFGEEITSTSNDDYKFASTYRDSATGLDYAVNRYYASGTGRFLSADPYQASGGPASPQSWNRYSYVHNDPINYFDPLGTNEADPNASYSPSGGLSWGFYFIPGTAEGMPTLVRYGPIPSTGMPPAPSASTGGMPSEDPDQRAILNKGLARAKDLIKKSECAGLFSTGSAAKDLQALIDSKPAPSVAAIAQSALSRNAGFGTASQAATSILGGMATTIEYSEDFNAKVWLGGQNVTFSSLYLSRVIGGLNSVDDLTVTVLHEALHSLGVDHGGGRTYGTPADMDKAIKENCLQ